MCHVLSPEPFCRLTSKSPLKSNLHSLKMQGLLNTNAVSYDLNTQSWNGLPVFTNISPQFHQKIASLTFLLGPGNISTSSPGNSLNCWAFPPGGFPKQPISVSQCLSFSPIQLEVSQAWACVLSCHGGFGPKNSTLSSLFLPFFYLLSKMQEEQTQNFNPMVLENHFRWLWLEPNYLC